MSAKKSGRNVALSVRVTGRCVVKIGLVDVDGTRFPNLVLMKLSAWHKARGDNVHLLRPDDVLLGGNLFGGYDKLYAACVFTENRSTSARLKEMGAGR